MWDYNGNRPVNLTDRIYQLVISRLDGEKIPDKEYQDGVISLVRKGIGGFILFGGRKDVVTPFIAGLQGIARIPLFIASDIERGVGQQIDGYTSFPCQMAIRAAVKRGDKEDMALLRQAIEAVALEAIDAGINMPLIPVLDVNSNPDNPIICTRAFSDNPGDVSFFGDEYIRILERMGLISCAKHFPGHGDTSTDSHISLPLITKSYYDLVNSDVRPFREAIKTGAGSIMIGHLLVQSIDDSVPSSMSKKVITDMLRKELGFNGLIMTDALNMSAISGIENVEAICLNAGVDIILHPSDAGSTIRKLTDAVSAGLILEETIDTAIDRILKAKSRLSQVRRVEVDYRSSALISKRMTEMSITAVNMKEGILPVADDSRIQVVIGGEDRLCERSLWGAQFRNICGLTVYDENSPSFRGRESGGMGFSSGAVIIAIFSEVAAWRGNSGIDGRVIEQAKGLIRKARASIVISFGSPYILRHFRDADVIIAAYEAKGRAQEAAIKCLKGEACLRGMLPVQI